MQWLNSTTTNHQRTRHRSQSLPNIVVAMNASLKYNAVILPQGRKAGERNKKNASEKASPEPRVNFAGRINNSACHRGAWDMWPTCLCKQRLTAVACLLHLSIGILGSLFTLFECWKSFVTAADTWNRNSLIQRLWPRHWYLCNQQIRESVTAQRYSHTFHIHTLKLQ